MTRRQRELRKVEGEAQAKRLIALYRNAEADIVSRLQRMIDKYGTDAGKKPSVRLLRQQYKVIRRELKRLDAAGRQEAATMVGKTYNGGFAVARRQLKDAGIVSGLSAEMSGVHKKALAVYSEQVQSRLSDLVTSAGRTVGDIYRQLQLNTTLAGAVAGTQTLKHVQDKMARLAEKGGLISFVDSAGRNWNMGSYVEMLSRTTLMQVHNAATWNEFAAHGEDLIQISYHTPTCGLCAPWNGKVLSLTGKTPGYPTLAEAEGAGLFHPNCRHASSLWLPDNPEEQLTKSAEQMDVMTEAEQKSLISQLAERSGQPYNKNTKTGEDIYYDDDGRPVYPPNSGARWGSVSEETITSGILIDRYGDDRGRFLAPYGTPFEERSLPRGTDRKKYRCYEVVKPIKVKKGVTLPWFGEVGGGVQYETEKPIYMLSSLRLKKDVTEDE
ncbi:MAG: phage minor capsid protein [Pyramidobacter sp.]|jgi:hypothetical protein